MPQELTAEEVQALEAMQAEDAAPAPEESAEQAQEVTAEAAGAEQAEQQQESPQQAAQPAADPSKPPEGYVPHGALHQERERRKELERRLEALEAANQPKEEAPQYADPVTDPDGHRKWAEYHAQRPQQQLEQHQEQLRQQAAFQQRVQTATSLEREFSEKTPDYTAAVQFLHANRVGELRAQGFGDQEIQQQIANDANAIFDAATSIGENPAEMLYNRAVRAGYVRKKTEQEKLAAQATAQAETQSLSNVSGGSPKSNLPTVEQLANMTPKQLAEVPDEHLKAVMGG